MESTELKPLQGGNGTQNGNTRPFIPSSHRMMMPGTSRFGRSYQTTRADKAILVITLIANCILLNLAGGAIFLGIFLGTHRGSFADLCGDNEWFVAAFCMLAVGILLLGFVILAFFGICYKSSRILVLFVCVLVFLFCGEVAAGAYAFARRKYIEERYEACMAEAYTTKYYDPAFKHVTEAWDDFQDRFDCCGVSNSLDYLSNKKIPSAPKSCGGTKADAVGRQPCFKIIRREVLDHFYIIGGSAIGVAVIQLFAISLNLLLLRIFHKREDYE